MVRQTRPAIVTQRFGKGRTAAALVGDLWRWSMERESPTTPIRCCSGDN